MSNGRIESWLASQRRNVDVGGICTSRIVLVGPDGDAWGTWAIGQEDLDRAVDDAITMQGEDLPSGVYRCRLIGLDQQGNQIAMLPVRVTGRAGVTVGAGGETQAFQRATAVALSNAEQIQLAQANHIEKLVASCESLIEDRAILLEEFNKQMSENLDVQLRREEHAQQALMRSELWQMVKELAPPLIVPMLNAWAEEQDVKRKEKLAELKRRSIAVAAEKKLFPPGWPGQDSAPADSVLGSQAPPASSSPAAPPPPASSSPAAPPPPASSSPAAPDQSGAPVGVSVAPPPAIPPPAAPTAPPSGTNGGSRDGSTTTQPAHSSGADPADSPPLRSQSDGEGSSAADKRSRVRGTRRGDAKPPRRRPAGHATPSTGSG